METEHTHLTSVSCNSIQWASHHDCSEGITYKYSKHEINMYCDTSAECVHVCMHACMCGTRYIYFYLFYHCKKLKNATQYAELFLCLKQHFSPGLSATSHGLLQWTESKVVSDDLLLHVEKEFKHLAFVRHV